MAGHEAPRSIAIDRIRCDGYGSCAELLPEMIDLDDWGYPILRPGAVPAHLLSHARMAVDTCPVLALRLAPAPRATIPEGPPRSPSVAWAGPPGRGRG
jgi:ferredoxin